MNPEKLAAMEKEADELLAAEMGTSDQDEQAPNSPAPADESPAANAVEAETDILPTADAPAPADTASAEAPAPTAATVPIEQYEHAVRRMHQATTEAAEARRRTADLENRLAALETSLAQSRATPDQPVSSQTIDQPEDLPELMEMAEYYPEIAEPLRKVVQRLKGEIDGYKTRFRQMDEIEATANQQRHVEAIQRAHPDAYALAQSPEFSAWVQQQPPLVQQAIRAGSADDVIFVLNQYKSGRTPARTTPTTPSVSDAKRAATPSVPRHPSGTPAQPRFTHDQIGKMSLAEFAQYEAEIDKALSDNSVM